MIDEGIGTLPKKSIRITSANVSPTGCYTGTDLSDWNGDVIIDANVCNIKFCASNGHPNLGIHGKLIILCNNMHIHADGDIHVDEIIQGTQSATSVNLVPGTVNTTIAGVVFENNVPA